MLLAQPFFKRCTSYLNPRTNRPLAPVDTSQCAIILGASQVNGLRDAVRRTSQLAHQLLALSRADAHSLDAQPLQRVDLKALCETLLEEHLDAATAKRIDLGLDVQAVQVTGQEWLLRELLCNLLGLAIADKIARVHRSQLIVGHGLAGRGARVTLVFAA